MWKTESALNAVTPAASWFLPVVFNAESFYLFVCLVAGSPWDFWFSMLNTTQLSHSLFLVLPDEPY